MKLFSKILIVSFSLLLVQCKQQPVKNPLYEKIMDIIFTQSNNTVFDLITDYSSLDSEVDVIIASKKRIDAARLDLIRSLDISALIDEDSSEQEQKKMFADRILTLSKFNKLIIEAQDSFKSHIVLILAQLENSDSEYEQAKAVLSSTDTEFAVVATTVLASLDDYEEKNDWYRGELQSLLEMVDDMKFETLKSEEKNDRYVGKLQSLQEMVEDSMYEEALNTLLEMVGDMKFEILKSEEKNDRYVGKLQSLQEMVEDSMYEEALNTLESDEMCEYYMSAAKMLNTLYAFEVYRAELILKAAKKVF